MKKVKKNSTENCHFYSHEISLYIAWECLRNEKGGKEAINILTVDGHCHIQKAFSTK